MECTWCGECCGEPFYTHVAASDVADWQKSGRTDLIEAFEADLASDDRGNPEMSKLGLAYFTCKFLQPEGPGRFACGIYEDRPLVCREFEVGCSKICPEYRGRADRKPGRGLVNLE